MDNVWAFLKNTLYKLLDDFVPSNLPRVLSIYLGQMFAFAGKYVKRSGSLHAQKDLETSLTLQNLKLKGKCC